MIAVLSVLFEIFYSVFPVVVWFRLSASLGAYGHYPETRRMLNSKYHLTDKIKFCKPFSVKILLNVPNLQRLSVYILGGILNPYSGTLLLTRAYFISVGQLLESTLQTSTTDGTGLGDRVCSGRVLLTSTLLGSFSDCNSSVSSLSLLLSCIGILSTSNFEYMSGVTSNGTTFPFSNKEFTMSLTYLSSSLYEVIFKSTVFPSAEDNLYYNHGNENP